MDDKYFLTGRDAERHFELNASLIEFSTLFKFEEENDRAIAIVGAAFLDTILEHILRAFLVSDEKEVDSLLKYDKPLGTFSGRIAMTYCLGLIPKTIRNDLRTVAKIRNRFAHDLNASFEEDQIRSWCSNLKWHRISYVMPLLDATARDLFQVGVHQIVTYLNGVVGIARGEARVVADYPWENE